MSLVLVSQSQYSSLFFNLPLSLSKFQVFAGSPLQSLHPREQGNRRPVYLQYEMLPIDQISRTVEALLADWEHIYHIFSV